MEVFFAQLINGISLGSIYALLATGLNLFLLVGGVIQFAYPHGVVLSMYICWIVLQRTGNNLALGILAAIGAGVGVSLLTEPLFRPLSRKGNLVPSFIAAVAIAMVITDMLSRVLHGGYPIRFPLNLSGIEPLLKYGLATITIGQTVTILGCFGAAFGLFYFLHRTRQGRALRAIGESPDIARFLGIPLTRLNIYSYVIAGLLGGISAVFLAMSLGAAFSTLGDLLILPVFAAVMFAGMGNLIGGLICGLIVGLVESFVTGYLATEWARVGIFGMLLVSLARKPGGIFGSRI